MITLGYFSFKALLVINNDVFVSLFKGILTFMSYPMLKFSCITAMVIFNP